MELKLALVQLAVGISKSDNLSKAERLIKQASTEGAKVVILPEYTNTPIEEEYVRKFAEDIPGESHDVFSRAAAENKVYLIAGSIPEKDGDAVYNTCMVFNPDGRMVTKYRKMHLFDINIPGKLCAKESDIFSSGASFASFDTPYCKFGIAICYDLRFPEVAQIYAKNGCKVIVYPAAFTVTTGAVHWKPLQVSRALDNQLYVASCSPATDKTAKYPCWGHSMVVSPWGQVLSEGGHEETIVYADIDLNYVDEVREQIPLTNQKRPDMYTVQDLSQ